MADANVVALQNAINRYAAAVPFSPIVPTGVVGPETLGAAKRALGWIAVSMAEAVDPISTQAAYFEAKATTSTTVLAVNAAPLAGFLNQVATTWGLPIVNSDGSAIVVGAGGFGPPQSSSLTTSIRTGWLRLPAWQKVAAILLALVGIMWGHKQYKQLKRKG